MKASLVYGRLIEVKDDKIVLVVDKKRVELPVGIELSEEWVATYLGKDIEAVVIDGEVKGFH
jgi:hypothetical protein